MRTKRVWIVRTSVAPDYSFLTHLHNAHTAPESDGNPHYSMLHGPYERWVRSPASGVTTCI